MATLTTPRSRPSFRNLHTATSTPTMRKAAGFHEDDIEVGDIVEVPGGMDGKVKFVGEVRGKPGRFVGIELSRKWASRGKNDGDADGIRYFSTSIPGAGIFLPVGRAIKRSSPATSQGDYPPTPTTPSFEHFSIDEADEKTPPTFPTPAPRLGPSASGRAPSPALKPKSRPSLPRPESPLRRTPAAAAAATTGGRQSLNMLPQNRLPGPRYARSPTPAKQPAKAPPTRATATPGPKRPGSRATTTHGPPAADAADEAAQLRSAVAEKNERIAALTAEFDAHRADFRSTLDTLDLASSETERVYEHKVAALRAERDALRAQAADVAGVARQLRQLEEVVQELEEGLEDARRGEAEARGEVEFLRGEVERVRAELRREREKGQEVAKANGTLERGASPPSPPPPTTAQAEVASPPPAAASPPRNPAPAQSGEIADKWCALCEGDGHDSISCPFERT